MCGGQLERGTKITITIGTGLILHPDSGAQEGDVNDDPCPRSWKVVGGALPPYVGSMNYGHVEGMGGWGEVLSQPFSGLG